MAKGGNMYADGGEGKTNKELSDMYYQMAMNIEEEMASDKGGETSGRNYEKLNKLQKEKDKYTALSIKYDTMKKMEQGGKVGSMTKSEFEYAIRMSLEEVANGQIKKVTKSGGEFDVWFSSYVTLSEINEVVSNFNKTMDTNFEVVEGSYSKTSLGNRVTIQKMKNNKMENGGKIIKNGNAELPAGEYYVGDLCYVMHDEWDEVCDLTIDVNECINGVFTLKNGTQFALYGTAYGDGTYLDSGNREYGVDSGTLGCVLVSKVDYKNKSNDLSGGKIINFETSFTTGYMGEDEQEIYFGMLVINTGYEDDDEDDNDEDDVNEDDYDDYDEDRTYAKGGGVGTETNLAFYGDKLKYIDYKNKTFKPIYFYEKLSLAKEYMEDEQKSFNKNYEHIILPYKNNKGTAYVIYRAVDKYATGGDVRKLPRKKFLLYTNPNNVTNRGYVAIGEDVKDVLRSSRDYKDSYTILYQGTGTNEDLQKAKSMYSNYSFGNHEEIMATGGGVETRKIKDFDEVKPGDIAIDFIGEEWEVIKTGKVKDLKEYDDSGIATEELSPNDNAIACYSHGNNGVFDYSLGGAVVYENETKTIPGLNASKQLSILEVDALYRREPKLDDPYYPKNLIKQVGDIAYYMVMVNEDKFLLAMDTTGNYDDKWYFTSTKSKNNMSTPKETGGASIRIELTNGNVTVLHGSSGEVLLNLQDVPTGTWDKLWDFLRNKLV